MANPRYISLTGEAPPEWAGTPRPPKPYDQATFDESGYRSWLQGLAPRFQRGLSPRLHESRTLRSIFAERGPLSFEELTGGKYGQYLGQDVSKIPAEAMDFFRRHGYYRDQRDMGESSEAAGWWTPTHLGSRLLSEYEQGMGQFDDDLFYHDPNLGLLGYSRNQMPDTRGFWANLNNKGVPAIMAIVASMIGGMGAGGFAQLFGGSQALASAAARLMTATIMGGGRPGLSSLASLIPGAAGAAGMQLPTGLGEALRVAQMLQGLARNRRAPTPRPRGYKDGGYVNVMKTFEDFNKKSKIGRYADGGVVGDNMNSGTNPWNTGPPIMVVPPAFGGYITGGETEFRTPGKLVGGDTQFLTPGKPTSLPVPTGNLGQGLSGYISGPGGPTDDKVPAMLSDGEFVLNADAVNALGLPFLSFLNEFGRPRQRGGGGHRSDVFHPHRKGVMGGWDFDIPFQYFADGGPVGDAPDWQSVLGSFLSPRGNTGGDVIGGLLSLYNMYRGAGRGGGNYSPADAINMGREAASMADPWASRRGNFQQMLENWMGPGGGSRSREQLEAFLADPSAITKRPAYQFRLKQGTQAIDRAAAAKGMLESGNRLMDLEEFGQGLASQEMDNEFNRLLRMAGLEETEFNRIARLAGVDAGSPAAAAQMLLGGFGAGQTIQGMRDRQLGSGASGIASFINSPVGTSLINSITGGAGRLFDWIRGGSGGSGGYDSMTDEQLENFFRDRGFFGSPTGGMDSMSDEDLLSFWRDRGFFDTGGFGDSFEDFFGGVDGWDIYG